MERQKEVTRVVIEHFQKVHEVKEVEGLQECTIAIPRLVDEDMNRDLMREVTDSEIKLAMLSLGALKAPGSDGMN